MHKLKALTVVLFFFNSSLAHAQSATEQGIKPTDLCYELTPDCICLTGVAIDEINKAMVDGQVCDEKLAIMRDRLEHPVELPKENHWWQEPQVVVSGVIVSFSFGALVGLLFSK